MADRGDLTLRRFALLALAIVGCAAGMEQARADGLSPTMPSPPFFTATLSNHAPLAFGMKPADAANALQAPLTYVRGRRGNAVYVAISTVGGSLLFPRRDRLYLQFRHDRLTGWKGDWSHGGIGR